MKLVANLFIQTYASVDKTEFCKAVENQSKNKANNIFNGHENFIEI
jgi:hypothetical protein